jgi:hypothetical protein
VTATILAAVTATQVVQRGKDKSVSFQIIVNTFDQLRRRACVSRSSLLFLSNAREAFWTTAITTFDDLNARQIFTPASRARAVLRATAKALAAD